MYCEFWTLLKIYFKIIFYYCSYIIIIIIIYNRALTWNHFTKHFVVDIQVSHLSLIPIEIRFFFI